MMVERPDEEQWREVVRTFGTPHISDRDWNMPDRTESITSPSCAGEVVLLIFNMAGSCAYVRRKGSGDWFYPMGRIYFGEPVLDAARREAMEEAGVAIVPVGVPLCERVTLNFRNAVLQRWHLLVVAETISSELRPEDLDEIEEARFFDSRPMNNDLTLRAWMNDIHRVGSMYLRSLDSMDGI